MQRLKSALVREYEENAEDIKVYNPRNTVGVDFYFTGEKTAKVCVKNKNVNDIIFTLYMYINNRIITCNLIATYQYNNLT